MVVIQYKVYSGVGKVCAEEGFELGLGKFKSQGHPTLCTKHCIYMYIVYFEFCCMHFSISVLIISIPWLCFGIMMSEIGMV